MLLGSKGSGRMSKAPFILGPFLPYSSHLRANNPPCSLFLAIHREWFLQSSNNKIAFHQPMDNNTQALVLLIKRQVLQMRQLRQFQWSLPEGTSGESTTMPSVTSPEVQQAILDQIFYDPVVQKHPPSPIYQHSFAKKLISMIESEGVHDVSDDLFEVFTDLMMTTPKRPEDGGPPLKPCFKSYSLDRSCSKVVTVMEEQTTISAGTTGLRTWEASYWLAEHFIAHPELLAGKNVVDVGCGVGFLGIACALLGAKKVALTDGNHDVLAMVQQNIAYNKVPCPTAASLLDWESFTDEQIAALEAQVLILSDLTYDPTNIVPLVSVLKALLVQGVDAYMSSAIRNPQTFVDFFKSIRKECVGVQIDEVPLKDTEHLFFFDEETVQTVKVFHLHFP